MRNNNTNFGVRFYACEREKCVGLSVLIVIVPSFFVCHKSPFFSNSAVQIYSRVLCVHTCNCGLRFGLSPSCTFQYYCYNSLVEIDSYMEIDVIYCVRFQ